MRVVKEHPPMFAEIDAVFHVAGMPVIFCWGDIIFNPMGVYVSPELRVHEGVHSVRQGTGPAAWWSRYLHDPEFRLAEEIPAHHEEYREFCRRHGNRNKRAAYLANAAERLAGRIYGSIITSDAARAAILAGTA